MSFCTRAGGRELLALALSGRLANGAELAGLSPLLLAGRETNTSLEFASQLWNPVPLSSFTATPIPRSASAWTVTTTPEGVVVATPAPFVASIVQDVPAIAGIAFATQSNLSPSSLVLAAADAQTTLGASQGQVATFGGAGIGLRPAPANGRSFYVREGLRELLHLALRGVTSSGGGLSSVYGHLIRSSFSWAAATPDLDIEALAPFLVPAEHLSTPPSFERTVGTWSFSIDIEGRAFARPAAPRTFSYIGTSAVTTDGLALTTSPTASGAGVLLAMIETSTGTLEPGNTVALEFSVASP